MALRGLGTLQALLGRDVTKRRKLANGSSGTGATASSSGTVPAEQPSVLQPEQQQQHKQHKQSSGTAAAAAEAPANAGLQRQAAAPSTKPPLRAPAARSKAGRPVSPLKQGNVRCPVCDRQLPNDDTKVNAHVDKCLSKDALAKRTQQASIVCFAAPNTAAAAVCQQSEAPQQQQQQRGAATCSSPAASGRPGAGGAAAALAAHTAAAAAEILDEAAAAGLGGNGSQPPVEIDLTKDDGTDDAPAGAAAAASWVASPPRRQQQRQQRQQQAAQSPSVSWPSSSQPSPSTGEVQQEEREQQQQQQQQQQTPSKPAQAQAPQARQQRTPRSGGSAPAPAGGSMRAFNCSVVGRKFQKHEVTCRSGQRLTAEPETDNPRANAILLRDIASGLPVGHLPHKVARILAPLMASGQVLVEAVVLEEPLEGRKPLPVELQVARQPAAPGATPTAARRAAEQLERALGQAEAAAAALLEEGPQATGERLHTNFLQVLATVQQHDSHLLAELETGFVAAYKALPLPCQCLFLRLFQRKGPLFRLASLAYTEVPDTAAAAQQLASAGLAVVLGPGGGAAGEAAAGDASTSGEGDADWRQLADLLPVPELASLLAQRRFQLVAASAGGNGGLRNRQQLLDALERHAARSPGGGAQLAGWLLQATGAVVQLAGPACEAVGRLQRLFFLNEGQTLSQFLASDLGVLQWPQYAVHRSCSAFRSRRELLEYEAALGHAAQLDGAVEAGDAEAIAAALQPAWDALDANVHKQDRSGTAAFLRQYHAGWVYSIMGTIGVGLLERQRRYEDAIHRLQQLLGGCFCRSRRGEWWERLAINMEHLNRPTQALEMSEAALADEWLSVGYRLALQRRVLRLGKPPRRWKRPAWAPAVERQITEVRITGRPLNNTTGTKSVFWGLDDQQCGVEELALQYYASEEGGGWQGVHSEGGIWATLFGLLLWDALFMPVPDVFRTPFQTAPLDLDTPDFYPARKGAVDGCLARVAAGEAPDMLRAAWEQHRGTLCRGVNWDAFGLDTLQQVAKCVGGRGLAGLLRLLAQDHGGWSGGMPDLLLWHPGRRAAKLSEVKGPRDRLSDQQRAWIAALEDAGLRAEVLKVVEPAAAGGGGGRRGGKARRR